MSGVSPIAHSNIVLLGLTNLVYPKRNGLTNTNKIYIYKKIILNNKIVTCISTDCVHLIFTFLKVIHLI